MERKKKLRNPKIKEAVEMVVVRKHWQIGDINITDVTNTAAIKH